jgi:hypothetical protein
VGLHWISLGDVWHAHPVTTHGTAGHCVLGSWLGCGRHKIGAWDLGLLQGGQVQAALGLAWLPTEVALGLVPCLV